jgi:hypothetical protein
MMSEQQFNKMMEKLDVLIKITAANVFQGKPMADAIVFLANLDFGNTDIANILGTTPAYVNKVKCGAKKGKQVKPENSLKTDEKEGEKSGENSN